ncbi:MAG: zinc ribbon domain-containing protein [Deltaproteobacteria bacterium]|nr:zinc ribbon domain-containing protein [Deltaproteobacteria bacterium]
MRSRLLATWELHKLYGGAPPKGPKGESEGTGEPAAKEPGERPADTLADRKRRWVGLWPSRFFFLFLVVAVVSCGPSEETLQKAQELEAELIKTLSEITLLEDVQKENPLQVHPNLRRLRQMRLEILRTNAALLSRHKIGLEMGSQIDRRIVEWPTDLAVAERIQREGEVLEASIAKARAALGTSEDSEMAEHIAQDRYSLARLKLRYLSARYGLSLDYKPHAAKYGAEPAEGEASPSPGEAGEDSKVGEDRGYPRLAALLEGGAQAVAAAPGTFGLFWPVLGALIGLAISTTKGFSRIGGVLGGLLLGPLAVLMFFVGSVGGEGRKKRCPSCAEWIQRQAKVCRYCGGEMGVG